MKIVDVIKSNNRTYVVIDKPLNFKYRREGNLLLAEDDGFFDCYKIILGSSDAFCGRKFSIPMEDGTTIEAHGQVWHTYHPRAENELASVGVATIEDLSRYNVFCYGLILRNKLDEWLKNNTYSTDYYKYKKRQIQEAAE